jgi:hypothetical protein
MVDTTQYAMLKNKQPATHTEGSPTASNFQAVDQTEEVIRHAHREPTLKESLHALVFTNLYFNIVLAISVPFGIIAGAAGV